jgi:type IV secretion system protein VirD4
VNILTTLLLLGVAGSVGMCGLAAREEWKSLVCFWAGVGVILAYLVSAFLAVFLLMSLMAFGYHRLHRAASVVRRQGSKSRKKDGVASTFEILRRGSWLAMRRTAKEVRPSLRVLSMWKRFWVPTREHAAKLCRVGWLHVWSSVQDMVLVFGRPRQGKTGWLMARIIDAPGAVVSTTTRTDIYRLTLTLRSRGGRPAYVFNPTGMAGMASTVAFDPLMGCQDSDVAADRAGYLLSGGSTSNGVGNRDFWDGQAARVLTALLHAAALGNLTMLDILRWVANPEKYRNEMMSLLRKSPSAAAYVPDAEQFVGTNPNTRTSTTTTIMPALAWLTNESARAATTGAPQLNVAEFLAAKGTIYLLGSEESQTAPLVCAFTGHITREARRVANEQGGRLVDPLTMALDECALICPVPLGKWSADFGGLGIHIIAQFQSRAQLFGKWGETAARTILGNAGAVMLFSLGADDEDLSRWSKLVGERDESVDPDKPNGNTRKVAVVTPTQLTTMPPRKVVVIRPGMSPVIGWARMAWKRWDVRTQWFHELRERRALVAEAKKLAQTIGSNVTSGTPSIPQQQGEQNPAVLRSPTPQQRWSVDASGVAETPVLSRNGRRPVKEGTSNG